MSCQNSLSSVALMSCVGLTLSSKHVHRLSKYFCFCRPLARLPSTFPVTTSASKPFLLMTCPKKSSCLCLIIVINVRWTPAALSTSRLLFFSVHEIFSILRNLIHTIHTTYAKKWNDFAERKSSPKVLSKYVHWSKYVLWIWSKYILRPKFSWTLVWVGT